jgi:Ca2+:H+ antiporter
MLSVSPSLGMAFLVGGFRFSEQGESSCWPSTSLPHTLLLEFQQTAAQLNTSLMTLAVISLVIPSAFAYALESTVPEEQEREIILEMLVIFS